MTHLRHLIGVLIMSTLIAPAPAQTPEELAKLDPGGLYYQAWILVKQAEELEKKEQYVEAFTKYRKARTFFDVITINNPDFPQREGLKWRTENTTAALNRIHAKALAQQKEQQNTGTTPLLEIPGTPKKPLTVPSKVDPSGAKSAEVRELQGDIAELNRMLASRSNNRDVESAKIRQQMRELERKLAELATSPLRDQVTELNRQIMQLKNERDAMAAARDRARAEKLRTLRSLEATQIELAKSNAEINRLKAVIDKQTKVSGLVVKGQRDQIDKLKATIEQKDALLARKNKLVESLQTRLTQSEQMVTQLRQERDTLIEERDQMKVLLKMNEADRVQKLITQNVNLSKQLNEARENLKLVEKDATASKEKILFAKQALVVAKAKIQDLQKQKIQAELSSQRMEKRLKQTEADLLAQLNGKELNARGKAEIAMLRKVVDKYKAKIEAQRGAAELILNQSEKLAENDVVWQQAMAIFKDEKRVDLTLEELEVLDRANPSFTASIRPTAAELAEGTSALRAATKNLASISNRLFSRGDFEATRGTLELIIEQDPGAWEAMVNLGIVNLRLADPATAAKQFRKAILYAGDRKIPFAHFMLGDSLYRVELFEDAEEELRRSLSLEPNNAKAHILLGNIAGKTGRSEDAEFHFREAVMQDPNLYEPFMNLAILSFKKDEKDEAQKLYQQYLQKGGPARPSFEALFQKEPNAPNPQNP
ncbi:MAG: tetratricopeptide repeat protein [Akkermansiaceae bacterium]